MARHLNIIKALFVVIYTFMSVLIIAQPQDNLPQFRFNSVTVDNGLSINRTNETTKDTKGFIWIATSDGICRFDGLTTKNYYAQGSGIVDESDQNFTSIHTDHSGNLLAGSYHLYKFDYDSEKLERVYDEDNRNQPIRIRSIVDDGMNGIWIGARNGIFHMDSAFNIVHLPPDKNNRQYETWDLLVTKNKVWIGSRKYGLLVFSFKDSTYTNLNLKDETGHPVHDIMCLFKDNETIWVGTKNAGLFKIDENTQTVLSNEFPDNSVRRIRDITRDDKNDIWLGTLDGLYLYKPKTNNYFRYAYTYHPVSSITYNSIFNVFIDDDDIMWLSTFSGGVNYTDLNFKPIGSVTGKENNDASLSSPIVSCFTSDNYNNVYVGTDHGGLNYWNRKTGKFIYYPHAPEYISGTNIKCMTSDSSGKIWIGTYEGGISCFNPVTKKFKYYTSERKLKGALQSNNIYTLAFDKQNNLWISGDQGVDLLDIKTDSIHHKYTNSNKSAFCIDTKSNTVWYGNGDVGLLYFDWQKDTFVNYLNRDKLYSTHTIFVDSESNLWIGGKNGIMVAVLETGKIVDYTTNDGLSSNVVNSILEDNKKNIWVSTSYGLMKLVNAANSPERFDINIYTEKDGLQSNQFEPNSAYKSKQGELFFGGINGFNFFYPDKIKQNPFPPEMVITDLKIFNKPVLINQKINGQIVLDKSISEKTSLVLNKKQKIFTLEFMALHYSNPESNKYKYMLYPFEKEWNYAKYPRNFATYSSLPPGNYVFKLQGANNDGKWQNEVMELNIRIKPPFWITWWFITLTAISLILLFIVTFNLRIRQIKKQKEKLENLVEQRTIVLEQKTLELENLNKLKDKLFSIIAHDLKSPFQSILGFSDLLHNEYDEYDEESRAQYIGLINESAHSYYELLDGLLSWSRTQMGTIQYTPKALEVSSIIEKTVDLLQHKIQRKQIKLVNKINNSVCVFADDQMVNSVIQNLIGNAIKFTKLQGQITLNSVQEGDVITFSVEDNGIGMTPKQKNNLFSIGNTNSEPGTMGEPGTGLGLLICKEFIEKNKGKIWVKSEKGKGSTFFFTLPSAK
ncbi:two-component regulator propeller domain-containing protein [Saccharicrinis sp. FJH62]|uniref:ligand-binding sensor domain-containing protein n=1 Tax=Saccharicrinis sp. FJH62 TaxID=3344657 RepID=UPI0035D4D2BB